MNVDIRMPIPGGATYELIGTYDLDRLQQIVTDDLDTFMKETTLPTAFHGKLETPKYAVKLYRLTYRSVVPEQGNRPTIASGLVAMPDLPAGTFPVVSYQHGTVFDRSYVPSNPDDSSETRIMLAQFAAQGYVVMGADYFGRGLSDLPDSYLVRESTRQAVFDFYLTARDFLHAQHISIGHFFVSGWSQGGWVTMQYLHKLESCGVPVSAAAIASAPVDIFLTVSRWMNNPQKVDAKYLPGVVALHLQAQEFYHQQHGLTEAAIKPQYLQAARDLYENKISWESFYGKTPATLQDFLAEEFRSGGSMGDTLYWQTLQANNAYRWKSGVPLRVYHGGQDEVTPAYIATLPASTQEFLGGTPVIPVDAGTEADHRGIFISGVIDQKPWFDTIAGLK